MLQIKTDLGTMNSFYKRNMNTYCNKIQENHSVCKNVLQVYLESNVIRDIHVTL